MPASEPQFNRLLGWLSPDLYQAGMMYERIRRKLIMFFEGRQCGFLAEELADSTFDVVSKKLHHGDEIPTANPSAYLYGVARNVFRDHWKKPRVGPLSPDEMSSEEDSRGRSRKEQRDTKNEWDRENRQRETAEEQEKRLECLDQCLEELPAESRGLILEYYREEKKAKILSHRLPCWNRCKHGS